MNELREYVDHLFRNYKNYSGTIELKEEIVGNLEAKVSHLIGNGLNKKDAIAKAKNSITKIDDLIDGNIPVFIGQFQFNIFQIAYIYILIAWIVTIPFSIFRVGIVISYGLFFICIILGIVYLFLINKMKESSKKIKHLNVISIVRTNKIVWLLWVLYIMIYWVYLSAVFFSSNIWFSRTVYIDGPYQFGILIAKYALPLISIVIPLILNACIKLLPQYEAREFHE
ncbi:hypothetical protein [Bacillus sp. 03113]|uniref:hypothetical protein n=1 Tax=Bacillus sp. 03113 TaxID=2578211 RepID=UPI001144F15A|nr:hypothetical protein [Bacillus sp. 03113]